MHRLYSKLIKKPSARRDLNPVPDRNQNTGNARYPWATHWGLSQLMDDKSSSIVYTIINRLKISTFSVTNIIQYYWIQYFYKLLSVLQETEQSTLMLTQEGRGTLVPGTWFHIFNNQHHDCHALPLCYIMTRATSNILLNRLVYLA